MKVFITTLFVLLPLLFALEAYGQCPPSGGGDFEGNLTITGSCTVSSDIILKKKNLVISSTGSLTITGNFDNDGNGSITIDGGTLIITGAFNNNGNGTVTVQNGGTLDVGTDYYNSGNGTSNFIEGTISIGGDYTNAGNGNIDAGGVVTVGGDFSINGNGTNTISGGLSIGGIATLGSQGIDIADGGVVQANEIESSGTIDIDQGGTLNVISGNITGTVNNDPGNADQDCTNNCCGSQCNSAGDDLSGSGQAALPVELLYFTAEVSEQGIQTHWASSTEINNDYYTLERSYDNVFFETIATIDGAGNSNDQLTYHYLDSPSYRGVIYYRLSQTDFDGAFEQFQIIGVSSRPIGPEHIKVYPTLLKVGDDITVIYPHKEIKNLDLRLVDVNGRKEYSARNLRINDEIQFSTSEVSSGVYLLQGHINGIAIQERLLFQD